MNTTDIYLKGPAMQRVTISRFTKGSDFALNSTCELTDDDGTVTVVPIESQYSAVIEGDRDDGSRWIMFVDADGSPELFWSERDPDGFDADGNQIGGGVIGKPINLQPDRTESVGVENSYKPV